MKILISGGGTGGHIFPAIAIAKGIQERYPDAEIEFVGAKDKMEMEKVPSAGFKIYGLWISGLQRKLTLKNIIFPIKIFHSLFKCYKILKRTKPVIVIGVGGFASGPLLYMANILKISTLIQEQNSYPGITNKLLAKGAKKICVAFDNMDKFFSKEKIVLTGNPIRTVIFEKLEKGKCREHFDLAKNLKTVLVIGGSLGARTINLAMEKGFAELSKNSVQILWQTGKFYNKVNQVLGKQVVFIKEMGMAYGSADLVVSRAGAASISEIAALGKACIFVPSPNVSEDHQTKNAMAMVNAEAALLVKDNHADKLLVKKIIETLADNDTLTKLSTNIKKLAKPEATAKIIEQIEQIIVG